MVGSRQTRTKAGAIHASANTPQSIISNSAINLLRFRVCMSVLMLDRQLLGIRRPNSHEPDPDPACSI